MALGQRDLPDVLITSTRSLNSAVVQQIIHIKKGGKDDIDLLDY